MNLKELSKNLGLSPTTVSRALNGYPEVSEATRERVRNAAQQHNYHPNTRAKALATGRAMAIGHVIPLSNQHEMVNPVFGDFISGAGEVYAQRGYDMVLSIVDDGQEERAYRDLKAKGTIDGVIIHGPHRNDPRPALLTDLGLPFVVHGRTAADPDSYWWIDMNNAQAFYRATRFLLDLGHRRIALFNGLEHMDFALRRRNGYERAMTEAGLTTDTALMRSEEMSESYGYLHARDLLKTDTPPTAFLVSSIIMALGVRRALDELGLRMGQDVSILTHDDGLSYFPNGGDVPIFTSTQSSVRQAGRMVADMLIERILTPTAPPKSHLLEAALIVGSSTGPAPKDLST
ncbi:LacI family DNA-binding transcriptional regulator [Nereida sp. MMG025]|uniref:LacI family DNA-binding transcriptional regulator n=1 Tax=Nereida sp. MMG025 TaxID=2909981 RepID=UPI001F2E5945|nr:substrate-binding domain-containing protein [Nereida sp. MMG025]MCF6443351.1 substrate-binding domain-containing protein [Nereida sp. MMG025]